MNEAQRATLRAAVDEHNRKQLYVGEVVRLKSGGPNMTVGSMHGQYVNDGSGRFGWGSAWVHKYYECEWFDDDGKARKANFYPEQLVRVAYASPPPVQPPSERAREKKWTVD